MSLNVYDMKILKCEKQHYKCGVCGELINPYTCQLAHRIPKTKFYLKLYGKKIIHHEFNMIAVCSLKCNSAVLCDPKTRPVEAQALIEEIKKDLKQNS